MISIPFLTRRGEARCAQLAGNAAVFFERLANPAMVDSVNDFTRMRMLEEGFYRRILPPFSSSNDELDRSVDTDIPVRIMDDPEAVAAFRQARGEPVDPDDSDAAGALPFTDLPASHFIRGQRYRVTFDRVDTP